ncbi:unnamed protein product [Nippostrongylus brasiliensis]|uniref:Ovule protein n=1 Tax=Nippostrongylus brasiliensis TaxID=27835 RepID=A0A0N4XS30_NIPBR|nr:unnamed protein product [Nippostrongylus brasiliensis]
MIQIVRKTMMVGAMPGYYSRRKYSMQPKELKSQMTKDEPTNISAEAKSTVDSGSADDGGSKSSTVAVPEA